MQMKYNPIQLLMHYYRRTAGFLKSHLRQGELEDKLATTRLLLRDSSTMRDERLKRPYMRVPYGNLR